MPAAPLSISARRAITALRSAVLMPLVGRKSSARPSCRGTLNSRIGSNAFFIACFLHDAIVTWEATPHTEFHEEMLKFRESWQRDARRAECHRCADQRIKHPR